jgi:hypothetical protein
VAIREERTQTRAECPRCGYDLSGAVATWADRCPVEGLCSECGLGFRWSDVLGPERLAPGWSSEHGGGGAGSRAGRFVRTFARTLRPRGPWGSLPLGAPIHAGRLALFAVMVAGVAHAGTAAAGMVMSLSAWRGPGWPSVNVLFPGVPGRAGEVLSLALMPLASGGTIPVVPSPLVRLGLLWGALTPLPFLLLPATMSRARVRRAHLWRGWVLFLPVLCAVLLGAEVVVTAVHRWLTSGAGWRPWMSVMLRWAPALLLALPAWYWSWWRAFTERYLRLEHARGVTLAMLVIAFLLAAIALLLAGPGLADELGAMWVGLR